MQMRKLKLWTHSTQYLGVLFWISIFFVYFLGGLCFGRNCLIIMPSILVSSFSGICSECKFAKKNDSLRTYQVVAWGLLLFVIMYCAFC